MLIFGTNSKSKSLGSAKAAVPHQSCRCVHTDVGSAGTVLHCVVCSLSELKPWAISWCAFAFRQPDYYFGGLFVCHQGRSICIYLRPIEQPAEGQENFSVRSIPVVLMRGKLLGLEHIVILPVSPLSKLSGIQNHGK